MTELTEQEKAQRRREKRQQRILNSAGDRLSRITGTAFPHRETPTPSPTTSSSSINNNKTDMKIPDSTRSRSTSPFPQPTTSSEGLRSRHGPTATPSLSTTSSYLDQDPSEDLGAPQPLDPFNMFNPTFQQGGSGGEFSPDLNELLSQGGFPLNNPLFASMLNNAAGGTSTSSSTINNNNDSSSITDPTLKYWNILHLISMFLLGFYAIYLEWSTAGVDRFASLLQSNSNLYGGVHIPLFWYFATMELCLQSARLFYQNGGIATSSTLGAIATQLPPPFNNIVTVFLRYRLIWSCLVQDCCVLVFIIGFAQVLSALLV